VLASYYSPHSGFQGSRQVGTGQGTGAGTPHFARIVPLLEVKPCMKHEIVERLAHKWDIVPSTFSDVPLVIEEQVIVVEVCVLLLFFFVIITVPKTVLN